LNCYISEECTGLGTDFEPASISVVRNWTGLMKDWSPISCYRLTARMILWGHHPTYSNGWQQLADRSTSATKGHSMVCWYV